MEPPAEPTVIPSISSGSVGSRFVTQGDLDTAKARRDEQWKAAYARLAPYSALALLSPLGSSSSIYLSVDVD
jgi:hypothetical protein